MEIWVGGAMMRDETGHNDVHGSFTPSNELPLVTNRCEFEWAVSNPSEAIKRTTAFAVDPRQVGNCVVASIARTKRIGAARVCCTD